MKNQIITIKNRDVYEIRKRVSDTDIFFVEIEGRECKNLSDYLNDISRKFHFPTVAKGLDGYNDWITDLTWLDKDDIVVIINNYREFLQFDLMAKKDVIDCFEQSILPWWEAEVCNCVVDGRTKSFIVYLVE